MAIAVSVVAGSFVAAVNLCTLTDGFYPHFTDKEPKKPNPVAQKFVNEWKAKVGIAKEVHVETHDSSRMWNAGHYQNIGDSLFSSHVYLVRPETPKSSPLQDKTKIVQQLIRLRLHDRVWTRIVPCIVSIAAAILLPVALPTASIALSTAFGIGALIGSTFLANQILDRLAARKCKDWPSIEASPNPSPA